jgi:hypothetical protein
LLKLNYSSPCFKKTECLCSPKNSEYWHGGLPGYGISNACLATQSDKANNHVQPPSIQMKNSFHSIVVTACVLISSFSHHASAQTEQEKLTAVILEKDGRFWNAYNNCDAEKFKDFFTDDVEFYHDKGGATIGIEALTDALKKESLR